MAASPPTIATRVPKKKTTKKTSTTKAQRDWYIKEFQDFAAESLDIVLNTEGEDVMDLVCEPDLARLIGGKFAQRMKREKRNWAHIVVENILTGAFQVRFWKRIIATGSGVAYRLQAKTKGLVISATLWTIEDVEAVLGPYIQISVPYGDSHTLFEETGEVPNGGTCRINVDENNPFLIKYNVKTQCLSFKFRYYWYSYQRCQTTGQLTYKLSCIEVQAPKKPLNYRSEPFSKDYLKALKLSEEEIQSVLAKQEARKPPTTPQKPHKKKRNNKQTRQQPPQQRNKPKKRKCSELEERRKKDRAFIADDNEDVECNDTAELNGPYWATPPVSKRVRR